MLFRRSEESEARILSAIGMLVVVCVVATGAASAYANRLTDRRPDQLGIIIDSPFVGQGVMAGTPLLMHGVEVGEVTQVSNTHGQGVRLAADLQRGPTAGLTDTMSIDFRPANYFGVTGINLQPGIGGRELTDGVRIAVTPAGNFTLQALLSRLGEISHGVITPRLIDVIERATNYVDGLNPLIETMLVVSNSVATVQSVSTERLLRNATGISVATPALVNAVMELGDKFVHAGLEDVSEDFYRNTWLESLSLVSGSFFGALGKLESSHSTDLAPFTAVTKLMADVVPGLVPPDAIADTARELRLRLERLFTGPPDRPAVDVRVVLDNLPGIAAPINAVGGVPQ